MNTNQITEQIQAEIFEEYLMLKGYSTATRQTIKREAERFAKWSQSENLELAHITYSDIIAYVNHCKKKGNKQRTLQVTVNGIRHYYNFLLSREEITDNPCTNIDIKGVKRKTLYETFTPEELETIYKNYAASPQPGGIGSHLTHKRNKAILSLILYQGLRTKELANLQTTDIKMREGKIYISGSRRTNEREMTLEAHQLYDLMDYINETRKQLLMLTGKTTSALFISLGSGERFHNLLAKLSKQLLKQNPKLKDIKQLRTSVITNWLKVHGLRKVQHLAGHRYVSSTEAYQVNNMEGLIEDVNHYHPDL